MIVTPSPGGLVGGAHDGDALGRELEGGLQRRGVHLPQSEQRLPQVSAVRPQAGQLHLAPVAHHRVSPHVRRVHVPPVQLLPLRQRLRETKNENENEKNKESARKKGSEPPRDEAGGRVAGEESTQCAVVSGVL
eukprot:4557251-Pyramimonas_sp.AAC.1